MEGLGLLTSPVVFVAHGRRRYTSCTHHVAFLAQACQRLWLVLVNDVYEAFTCVDHTFRP